MEQVVVSSIAASVNSTDGGKDTSVMLLLNNEGVAKFDVKEDKGGDKGRKGESKGGGGGKEELRVGGELSASVDSPKNDSWLRNMTEVRLWIGELSKLKPMQVTLVYSCRSSKRRVFQAFVCPRYQTKSYKYLPFFF